MNLALINTEFYEKINHTDNPVYPYLQDEKLNQDIWVIDKTLPHLAQEAHQMGRKTINFQNISLKWLNELTKLAILIASGNRRWKLCVVTKVLTSIGKFDKWLVEKEYIMPSVLTQHTVQQWLKDCHQISRKCGLAAWLIVLHEIKCVSFTIEYPPKPRTSTSKPPKTIPEKIKYELDCHLENLDPTIYLSFKLLEGLGLRSTELSNLPLNCLRQREGIYQIRIATEKQDNQEKERDIPKELVLLVEQQQRKVKSEFRDDFPWLFPNWRINTGHLMNGFLKFDFFSEQLRKVDKKNNNLLKRIIKENNIKDEKGQLARVTTHDFRRTYATVANRMGKSPDQIKYGLRHLNLDMQDSYVNVLPQELEKRQERILVNKDGEITVYKTDKDTETLRLEWKLRQVETGICTRPHIMEECEYDHVCLGCEFVRFSKEHLPTLLEIKQNHREILNRCIEQGQSESRRANSVRQLLGIVEKIISQLETNPQEENK